MKYPSRCSVHSASVALAVIFPLALVACGCDDGVSNDDLSEVVTNYANGVHASYQVTLESANAMDAAVNAFVAAPTEETLDAAKAAWTAARLDYGATEAFRFYGGPIDSEVGGVEGLVNAWPMDEAYLDSVEGAPDSGIINNPDDYPTIDAAVLIEANEAGGETNIATGWHAIEFLLWGQDLSVDGPGERPVSDYVDAPNADRRATYLTSVSALLVEHLSGLVAAWDPQAGDNYYETFTAEDPKVALADIFTGIGELSRGELAGERMNVAYVARSQEDEQSCFSDTTTNDLIADVAGIQHVLSGDYPGGVSGPGIVDVLRTVDSDLADRLEAQVDASAEAVAAIPPPFDQHLVDGISDSDPGRASILTAINDLEAQTPTIVEAATALGVTINVT